MLWDARARGTRDSRVHAAPGTSLDGAAALSPVWSQDGAHTRPPAPGAARAASKAAKHSPVTVTSVAFVPHSYLLASGGAQDTVVKLWDLRMHGLPCCELELPKPPTSTGERSWRRQLGLIVLRSGLHCCRILRGYGCCCIRAWSCTGRGVKGKAAAPVVAPHEVATSCCPSRGAAVGITHIAVSPSGKPSKPALNLAFMFVCSPYPRCGYTPGQATCCW
jgi:denticleless